MGRVRATFWGRVQGVGFRATTRHCAMSHGLVGWVRNDPDGSVSMEAQGSDRAITDFLADLRAHFVRNIQSQSIDPIEETPGETTFAVVR